MPKLRGHHLICLQFFVGKGYNCRFVKNTFKVLKRVRKGRIRITNGLDDVCQACPYGIDGRCVNPKTSDKTIRKLDKVALLLLSIKPGSNVSWNDVRRRLPEILPIWIEKACKGCIWWRICKRIIHGSLKLPYSKARSNINR